MNAHPGIAEAMRRVDAAEETEAKDRAIRAVATNAVKAIMAMNGRDAWGATDIHARDVIEKALRQVPSGDIIAASASLAVAALNQAPSASLGAASAAMEGGE